MALIPAEHQEPAEGARQLPPPGPPGRPGSNPTSWWALGLGLASLLPGVAVGAVAAGVLGLVQARRAGGRGLVPSLVGLALAVLVLLADAGLGVAVGVAAVVHERTASVAAGAGDDGGAQQAPSDPDALPDPGDRTDPRLSTTQQRYIDDLDAVSYLNFTDSDLLAMGHEACRDFDAGRTPAQDGDRLGRDYGAGLGDAWDVQKAATKEFCPQHAALLDPASRVSPEV